MTSDTTITCPKCGNDIKLTETLAAPFIETARKRLEATAKVREEAMDARERELAAKAAKVQQDQASIATQVAAKVEAERTTIAAQEAAKAKQAIASDLTSKDRLITELSGTIKQLNDKLGTAQQAEADFRRKERELSDAKRELDLTIEKQVAGQLSAEREKARKQADEEHRLTDAEKDMKMAGMLRQIEELKRKAEQGSQQSQGEVQELDLEERLSEAFPHDTIEPVPKGQFGGDCLHRVKAGMGTVCGTILWESKRTKNWSGGWTDKLKQDQRAAKADVAVIVTQAMPSGVDTFAEVDGVWVSTPGLAIALAATLRMCLTECASARRASEGQQDKIAILYRYMTGPQFRQRVEAIRDAFMSMQEDLTKERQVITKQWAKRQQEIDRVMASTVGMYGDIQAIAGNTLQEIEGLELKALASGGDCATV